MAQHVAILLSRYIRLILAGQKTVESRLTIRPIPPYRAIAPGDRIWFKASSGPYMASATARRVEFHEQLTPARIGALKKRYNGVVRGDDAYWQWKQHSKYATFVTLAEVNPTCQGPPIRSSGIAWFVLPLECGGCDAAFACGGAAVAPRRAKAVSRSPQSKMAAFDVVLTAGALRNNYVRVPPREHRFPDAHYGGKTQKEAGKPLRLILPGGDWVDTDIVRPHMLRWRGWGKLFAQHDVTAGDVARFVQVAPGKYRVTFVGRSSAKET
ncbi:MAG: ASCH domain-containing protein [Phycisphaeraceae bacterium]